MADMPNPAENGENGSEIGPFHSDPVVNTPLVRLETTLREYKARHAAETSQSKDKLFEEWKAALENADEDNLPNMEDINEWVWNDASAAELIAFMESAKQLLSDVGFVIRRYYTGTKSDTTQPMENAESLSDHRKRCVRSVLDLIHIANSNIFPGLTEDMIRNLPSVEFNPRKNKDGTDKDDEEYINLPRAPKSPSGERKNSDGPKPLRGNNTKVVIVVNGEIYVPKGDDKKLGGACQELFKKSPQQCAKLYFNDWRDKNNDSLYSAPDGTVYGLRVIG